MKTTDHSPRVTISSTNGWTRHRLANRPVGEGGDDRSRVAVAD
jgi:hypothetical protein